MKTIKMFAPMFIVALLLGNLAQAAESTVAVEDLTMTSEVTGEAAANNVTNAWTGHGGHGHGGHGHGGHHGGHGGFHSHDHFHNHHFHQHDHFHRTHWNGFNGAAGNADVLPEVTVEAK